MSKIIDDTDGPTSSGNCMQDSKNAVQSEVGKSLKKMRMKVMVL